MLWNELVEYHKQLWQYIDANIEERIKWYDNSSLIEVINKLKKDFYNNHSRFITLGRDVCVGCYIGKELYFTLSSTVYTTICEYCPFVIRQKEWSYTCREMIHPYMKLLCSSSLEEMHKYCNIIINLPFDSNIEYLYKTHISKKEV